MVGAATAARLHKIHLTADELVDEVDRRIALLGERLACERGDEEC